MLRHVQNNIGMRTRFHLFVEYEVIAPQERIPPNRSLHQETRYVDLNTKVLYSPTISFNRRQNWNQNRKLLHDLVTSINELSFQSMSPAAQNLDNHTTTPTPTRQIRRPIPRLFPSEDEDSLDEELLSIEPFTVPDWFSFMQTEYCSGPQAVTSDPLMITEDVAGKFDSLPNDDVCNLYRTFFEFLHACAKKKRRSYKQGKLKYSMFTPPWIRTKLIVSGNICELPKLVVQDQREQRNKQGYKRMAWIMAAFYEKESSFGRYVLEFLLGKLPELREEWNKRQESRRQLTTPIQKVLGISKNNARRRSRQHEARHVRRRLDAPEDAMNPALAQPATLPQNENAPVLNHTPNDPVDQAQYDIRNHATNETHPEREIEIINHTRTDAIQKDSLESMNRVTQEAVHSNGAGMVRSEDRDGMSLNTKSNAGKSVFEGISVPKRDSTARNKQLRNSNQKIINGDATKSQHTSGGPPIISLSSSSNGRRPPIEKHQKKKNRRLEDNPTTVHTSDEDPLQSTLTRQQTRRNVPLRKEKRNKKAQAEDPEENLMFMTLHGARVSFDVGIENGDSKLGGSRTKENETQSPLNTDKPPAAADNVNVITCAAGTKCIFASSVEAQSPDAITGRCRSCSKHLHDLCGGGEEGTMICPACSR